jgi:hypothetical protein
MKRKTETEQFLEAIAKIRRTPQGQALFYELDTVDNKTQSLLTHVSLMMTVLSIFFAVFHGKEYVYMRFALLFELLIYLLVALLCLRAIFMVGPGDQAGSVEAILRDRIVAVQHRVQTYKICLLVAMVTTVVFVMTIVLHLVMPAIAGSNTLF